MAKGYLFISNSNKPDKETSEQSVYKLGTFEYAPICAAQSLGFKLFLGVNRSCPQNVYCEEKEISFYDQHTYRNIFALRDNIIAYRNLCEILKKHPEIEVIHCNTPIGGFLGRVCGHKYGTKKIIYTAHGFHFFKGAPFINRTVFKWIEKFLAHWTDVIITMNEEDYENARIFKLKKGGKVFKVPGVGINIKDFQGVCVDKLTIRQKLGIPKDSFVGIAMGDVISRKNYHTAIQAIALTGDVNIHYIICGKGSQIIELKGYADELGISDQIHFLGFRSDIKELLLASDFFLFASFQEGLPRSTMEAMASGLPCVVSNIRGNVDLIDGNLGGYLVEPKNANEFANAIKKISQDSELAYRMGLYNKEKIKQFDMEIVKQRMLEIYKEVLKYN